MIRPAESTLSDDENDDGSGDDVDDDSRRKHYAFPDLDFLIRQCVKDYEAVFPKLNFSSPKDAAWLLPASSPLKCTSPADVYLLLKSSDFINHDLNTDAVFEGCQTDSDGLPKYDLELVLRKWYPVDRGRELRCFVRGNELIGISQRDTNYYEFWNDPETQDKVSSAVREFWEKNIRPRWTASSADYAFDFLLTRDLVRGHIIDFNPYAPKTDPLLFTYEELHALYTSKREGPRPVLLVIDSASHPVAMRNAPAHQHNMIPFEAMSLGTGRDIEEFSDVWKESVKESTQKGSA